MLLKNLGLNNDKCIHTLPLRSVPLHISPSLSLPLQTLRLVSLVSLITKTKRIADRSATNCDTHTDRQSTLDKYMIDKRIADRSATNCDTHTDRQSTLDKYMIDGGRACR